MSFTIQDKTILITGANRGIGKAIAETFLDRGARKVYAGVRDLDSALPLTEKFGARIQALHIDLAEPASIHAAAHAASDVEVVVNNAGILQNGSPLDENAIELLENQMHINVHGLLHMARAFAPVLKANGGGVVAQINSSASLRCSARFSIYAATKAAAYAICQGLREELAKQGTHMLSVHPGPIATDMAVQAGIDKDADPPHVVPEAMLTALKQGRFLVFPGKTATKVGDAYRRFAETFIEAT